MKRIGVWLALLAGLGLVSAGCGKSASDKAAEKTIQAAVRASGQEADVSVKSGTTNITTKDGAMAFGEGAKVPDNWPSDVPVYSKLKLLSAVATPPVFTVSGTTSDTADAVLAYYKEHAAKNGWKEDQVVSQPPMSMLTYSKDTRKLNIIISSEGAERSVSITIGNA